MKRLILLISLISLMIACPVFATDITLEWDANSETDLGGYRLHYKIDGPGGPYDGTGAIEGPSPIDVGNVTRFTIHGLPDLAEGQRYRFVATAYSLVVGSDGQNLESGYSNEADAGVPTNPGNLVIVFSTSE